MVLISIVVGCLGLEVLLVVCFFSFLDFFLLLDFGEDDCLESCLIGMVEDVSSTLSRFDRR